MATETLTLNAAGDEESIDFGTSGPGNHWQDCDAEDANFVQCSSAVWLRDLYNCDDSVVGAGTINSVTVYIKCRAFQGGLGGSYCAETLKSGGVVSDQAQNVLTLDWQWFNHVWVAPPEGGDWTWAKINALQPGVLLYSAVVKDPEYAQCDKVYVVVDYTPEAASGGMAANMAAKMIAGKLI